MSTDRRTPWHQVSKQLVDVASGRSCADTIITNGRWVNVHTGEIIPAIDVAISGARIAYVGTDASRMRGPTTQIIDAGERYIIPGLCDAHMHVESGMVTVTEFSRAVIPHGTTAMFIDPHEIANVLGMPGVRLMHDEAQTLPIGVYVQMPSCVPSAPGLEDAGATIGPAEVAEAMNWPGIIGLGEMMSFPEVVRGDDHVHAIIASAMAAGKTVGGHYPASTAIPDFHAYVASGPADDHEVTEVAGAIERARRGMTTMCRLGSAWYDVAETVRAITEYGIDARQFVLCTDDSHSGTLVADGHMDRVVRHAIACGLRPVTAIQMATLNTAEHFGVARDIGSITPGRVADIIVSSDLVTLPIELVFAAGRQVAAAGTLTIDIPPYPYPQFVYETVKINRQLVADDFKLPIPDGTCETNVIGIIENQAPSRALVRSVTIADGKLRTDWDADLAQVTVVERHSGQGALAHGLVSGFGFNCPCAIASTVMHDSHNMLVVGTDSTAMSAAANRLRDVGGGVSVWRANEELAMIELPIAGLMSDERAETVATKAATMVAAMAQCGCTLNNAFMQLSLLGLVVIPELRISNRGIIDVTQTKIVPLVTN